jgi:hypothetical protein
VRDKFHFIPVATGTGIVWFFGLSGRVNLVFVVMVPPTFGPGTKWTKAGNGVNHLVAIDIVLALRSLVWLAGQAISILSMAVQPSPLQPSSHHSFNPVISTRH